MKKNILLFFVTLDVVILDILTKYWVNISNPDFQILWNWLAITHVKNTGIAFGTPLPGISFLIPLILLGIAIALWKSWKKFGEMEKLGYLMILTGGSLNALERTLFGSVTDFIAVKYFSVFNLADIAITVGVILLFWSFVKEKK